MIWTHTFRLATLAIAIFTLLLLFTLMNLLAVQKEIHAELREANTWPATQAEREAQNFLLALSDRPGDARSPLDEALHLELLYSRVLLLSEEPQLGYFRAIGMGTLVSRAVGLMEILDARLQATTGTDADRATTYAAAAELASLLRQLAVDTNLAERREGFRRRDEQERIVGVLTFAIFGVMATGAGLALLMIRNLRVLSATQEKLKQHQMALEKTIAERTQQLRDALAVERRAKEVYRSFIVMVSHQFRTPVSVIHLIAQRQSRRRDHALPEDTRKRFQKIFEAAGRLDRILNSFLDAACIDGKNLSISVRCFNFPDIVGSAVRQIAETDPGYIFETEFPANPLWMHGDPLLLEQVLLNLIGNATKYSPPGAKISISTSGAGGWITCSVQDEGVGIPEIDQPAIFEKFYRAPGAHNVPGFGVGLSLARDIAVLHGGEISFCSRENEGSTFTVKLPAGNGSDT